MMQWSAGSDRVLIWTLGLLLTLSAVSGDDVNRVTYWERATSWYDAYLTCHLSEVALLVPTATDFSDLDRWLPSNGSKVWVGGRYVHSAWTWTDDGCGAVRGEGCVTLSQLALLTTRRLTAVDAFACLTACNTTSVGLQGTECFCLKSRPQATVSQSYCSFLCAGNFDQSCGGLYYYSVYTLQTGSIPWDSDVTYMNGECGYLYLPIVSSASRQDLRMRSSGCNPSLNGLYKQFLCENCSQSGDLCDVSVHSQFVTWAEARNRCLAEGGQLLNLRKNRSLPLIYHHYVPLSYWVGMRRDFELTWINGSQAQTNSFKTAIDRRDGLCLAASRGNNAVHLSAIDCDTQLPYLCDPNAASHKPPTVSPQGPGHPCQSPSLTTMTTANVTITTTTISNSTTTTPSIFPQTSNFTSTPTQTPNTAHNSEHTTDLTSSVTNSQINVTANSSASSSTAIPSTTDNIITRTLFSETSTAKQNSSQITTIYLPNTNTTSGIHGGPSHTTAGHNQSDVSASNQTATTTAQTGITETGTTISSGLTSSTTHPGGSQTTTSNSDSPLRSTIQSNITKPTTTSPGDFKSTTTQAGHSGITTTSQDHSRPTITNSHDQKISHLSSTYPTGYKTTSSKPSDVTANNADKTSPHFTSISTDSSSHGPKTQPTNTGSANPSTSTMFSASVKTSPGNQKISTPVPTSQVPSQESSHTSESTTVTVNPTHPTHRTPTPNTLIPPVTTTTTPLTHALSTSDVITPTVNPHPVSAGHDVTTKHDVTSTLSGHVSSHVTSPSVGKTVRSPPGGDTPTDLTPLYIVIAIVVSVIIIAAIVVVSVFCYRSSRRFSQLNKTTEYNGYSDTWKSRAMDTQRSRSLGTWRSRPVSMLRSEHTIDVEPYCRFVEHADP